MKTNQKETISFMEQSKDHVIKSLSKLKFDVEKITSLNELDENYNSKLYFYQSTKENIDFLLKNGKIPSSDYFGDENPKIWEKKEKRIVVITNVFGNGRENDWGCHRVYKDLKVVLKSTPLFLIHFKK